MLEGYNLIKSDHPSNTGGACIYYKEYLAVRLVDIRCLPRKKRYVAVIYS